VTTAAGESPHGSGSGADTVSAGRVGRAHGLDGSFYVTGARSRLLALGTTVVVAGRAAEVVRRAGTEKHPIVRLEGIEDRSAAEAMRGLDMTVDLAEAPRLQEGEWWASELEGCEVVDGERHIGRVVKLIELPSCEALEVRLESPNADDAQRPADDLLVPMVRDAIRHIDVVARRIDVDMSFVAE
jgi:16S rRNA processing protein RimM